MEAIAIGLEAIAFIFNFFYLRPTEAHFQSQPSAVVPHRSPLGAAGVPPSVATVRGTAGPEPLAMTPLVSATWTPRSCAQKQRREEKL